MCLIDSFGSMSNLICVLRFLSFLFSVTLSLFLPFYRSMSNFSTEIRIEKPKTFTLCTYSNAIRSKIAKNHATNAFSNTFFSFLQWNMIFRRKLHSRMIFYYDTIKWPDWHIPPFLYSPHIRMLVSECMYSHLLESNFIVKLLLSSTPSIIYSQFSYIYGIVYYMHCICVACACHCWWSKTITFRYVSYW